MRAFWVTMMIATFLAPGLAGCSGSAPAAFQEAAYIDQEFGKATRASFDMQIANPDTPYKDIAPEGMDGINAENVVDIHNETYAEKPADTDVLKLGLIGGGSN